MIEPARIGRYLDTDSHGFVIPDVNHSLIDRVFQPVISTAMDLLFSEGAATAVYLRGSVPRGLAVPGQSDIDFLYLSDTRCPEWETQQEELLRSQFPQITRVELGHFDLEDFQRIHHGQRRPYLQMLLKTQSLHLAGVDVVRRVDPFQVGREMFSHVFMLEHEFGKLTQKLEKGVKGKDAIEIQRWFCRRVVRAGLEITLDRSQRYTRDLMLCYEQFAEFYPERAKQMYSALLNALNGNEDSRIFGDLVHFLRQEAERRFLPLAPAQL